jgi:hypothetical protein
MSETKLTSIPGLEIHEMNQIQSIKTLPVELYTGDEVLSGRVSCPSSSRLLDLLNNRGVERWNAKNELIEFHGFLYGTSGEEHQGINVLRIRKSALHLVAVDDVDLGRGAGADNSQRVYPVVNKTQVRVTLRLPNYTLLSNIHCSEGQTIEDLMNSDMTFLPLTHVTITRDQHEYGTRPFVAVNKEQIIWSQGDQ